MNLIITKTELFNAAQCDFWTNEKNEVFMTTEQLGAALEYSQPKAAISKLLERNEYLTGQEFSGVTKLTTPTGGTQETRIFTEDGIYEVTMLSKTDKAKEFRQWVRQILKELRRPKVLSEREQLIASMKLSLETAQEITIIKNDLDVVKHQVSEELTLNHGQQQTLHHEIKKRVEAIKNDFEMTKRELYSQIHSHLRRAFAAPKYVFVKRKDYEDALSWVKSWRPLI